MKQKFSQITEADCSCLQVEVLVEESWIDLFLARHHLVIPINEQYNLSNIKMDLGEGKLTLQADIMEKKGSSILITCLPKWDVPAQRVLLEELEIKTLSKNILLKSAGWFAKTFLGAKIDKKIEEATNQLYTHQMNLLLKDGVNIPIKHTGRASVKARSITINEMSFVDHSIKVKALIDGYWHLHLMADDEG